MDINLILIKALQLVCCLSILVVLHEGGHFFFAKISGVKVEKFYLFFNPYFHLFSTRDKWFTRLFPYFKDNETEYGIGWIPLGGYVSIAGMVDETKNAKDIGTEVHDYDFSSKPVWKRFLIMFGGVLVNFITALVLYSVVMYTWGQDIIPMRNIQSGLVYSPQAKEIGFRNGDIPIKTDGKDIEGFSGALMAEISEAQTVTVLREDVFAKGNRTEVDIVMPEEGVSLLEMMHNPKFLALPIPTVVGEVAPDMPAEAVGIKSGALILSINGDTLTDQSDVQLLIASLKDILASKDCTAKDSADAMTLTAVVLQKGASSPDTVTMHLTDKMQMGVIWDTQHLQDIKTQHIDYSLLSSIPAGCAYGWETLTSYVSSLKYLFTREGAESVGSFITIGSIFPDAWDWQRFWNLTAFISIILAVMNILPIPGLDGGHIVLLVYEGITGHKPSPKSMEIIEKVGITLLCALMILAMGNDIVKFIL